MSRTGLSVFAFVVALCVSPAAVTAQPLGSAQPHARIAEATAEIGRVEPHVVTSKGSRSTGTIAALGRYFSDFGSYVHVQTVLPVMDFAGRSLHWVWAGSGSAVSAVYGGLASTVSTVSGTVTASVYWPSSALDEFVLKLHDGTFDEFNRLVGEAGFSIVNIELGISLVPDLSIEFEHVRQLSDEETVSVRAQIDEYLTRTTTGLGHLESAILRNLVLVGSYTGDDEFLNGIVVHLFPTQSAVLDFRVFGSEDKSPQQILKTIELAEKANGAGEMLEDRLSKIETAIRNLNANGQAAVTTVE